MIKEIISKVVSGKNLDFGEAEGGFKEIFDNKATSSQIAAFLTALRIKGETETEILAAASVIREKAVKVSIKRDFLGVEDDTYPVMDTCGTGGSGINKFNISTAAAFVVSAAGVKVAKHGNRAMSSSCGSADVLEELGINIGVSPLVMAKAIKTVGIGFLYAPLYHPALAEVAKIRREIGIRTIFNILGPLCNPALANYQLLGVYKPELTFVLAKVLKRLGVKRAFVVCGKGFGDEISLAGTTYVSFLNGKKIQNISLTPASFGLKKVSAEDVAVSGAKTSAGVIKGIFKGKKGSCRDIVLASASACFYILGKAADLKKGVRLAAELIDAGKVEEKFLEFKTFLEKNA